MEDFAHVHMMELQAGGEGHPEQLHLFALVLRQTLVSKVAREVMADRYGQLLCLLARLPQLIPQLQAVGGATDTGRQVAVTRHHLGNKNSFKMMFISERHTRVSATLRETANFVGDYISNDA